MSQGPRLGEMRSRARWMRTMALADGALILVGLVIRWAVPALRLDAGWGIGLIIPVSGLVIAYYALMRQ